MNRKGVTLIELMVVIAIVTILATISIINLKKFIDKTELTAVSYSVNSIVYATRAKTFSTERIHWMKYEDNWFNVYQDDGDGKFTSRDKKMLKLCKEVPKKFDIVFTNSKARKYGVKFSYYKNWWPAGSITFSSKNVEKSFKLTFPVNSIKCNMYEISEGVLTAK